MANTDSPGPLVEEIGGSFTLGQWLANHDRPFKISWDAWCSKIKSTTGVASDASIVLTAVLDVAEKSDVRKQDRIIVFNYSGAPAVDALKVSVEGNDLLTQVYARLMLAQEPYESNLAGLPKELDEGVDWSTIESEKARLPSAQFDVSPPSLNIAIVPDPLPRTQTAEAAAILPQPVTSIMELPSWRDVELAKSTLPRPDSPTVRPITAPPLSAPISPPSSGVLAGNLPQRNSVVPPSTPLLTRPSSPVAEVVTLPQARQQLAPPPTISKSLLMTPTSERARPIIDPPPTTPLPDGLAAIPRVQPVAPPRIESVKPSIVAQPATNQMGFTTALIPSPVTAVTSSPLPKPAEALINLSQAAQPPSEVSIAVTVPAEPLVTLPVISQPSDAPSVTPAAEFEAGQYLRPIANFPSDRSSGLTLAKALGSLADELPQGASDVLGDLEVREMFLVIKPDFKGLVLEVELDQPMTALVRLALARAANKWTFGGEVIIPQPDNNGVAQSPLVFTLSFGTDKSSKSLVMALDGRVKLVDGLLRPVFGDAFPIPQGLSLDVINPALVLIKEESHTKALIGVSLEASVDFGSLPFVGGAIKAQGPAKLALGIQYASMPFSTDQISEINSALSSDLQFTTPDAGAFNGLHLSVALQTTGKPLRLSLPIGGDEPQAVSADAGGGQSQTPASPATTDPAIHWIEVNKSAGPAFLEKVGVGFINGAFQFRVSASVQMSGLSFFCDGLGGGMKLKLPPEMPTFNLDGLGISMDAPPVSISGALIRSTDNGVDRFDGLALIKAANFTITGIGSYSTVKGDPSLFLFAILHKDLGGPAFFHVTGLAAGFGFNRALKLPPIDAVQNFPLVRGALDDSYFEVSSTPQAGIQGAMEKLRDYIPPSGGEYWFAVGVRFKSFEMIESFALLSITFGHEVVIALLGLSKMSLPKGAEPGNAIAYAELALRAVINLDEGSIAVEGRLTDNSYVFSQDCRLTGGFAFYSWFSGPHSGDFVITLGGYHPRFVRPAHYPIVPRLGVNWRVSSQLTVTAELYFALTPSCLMAGGKMSVVYEAGPIKAWYAAYCDFLLSWQPFYYTIDMGVTIGVEADLGLFSISVHLSVGLHIWGPEFAGEIDVDLSVVSFTIRFGPAKTAPPPLTAGEFQTAFLPPAKPQVRAQVLKAQRGVAMLRSAATPSQSDVITTQINSGLLRQEVGAKEEPLRVVNGHALALSAQSMIPVTRFGDLASATGQAAIKALDLLGIRPMGKTTLASEFSVSIRNVIDGPNSTIRPDRKNLRVSTIENGVPEALWGKSEVEGEVPPVVPEAKTINVTLGIRIFFAPKHPQGALPAMDIEKFAYETFNKPIPWDPALVPPANFSEGETEGESLNTAMSDKTTGKRNAVLDVLARQSPFTLNQVSLNEFVKNRESYFQTDPTVCRLGSLDEA